MQDGLIILFSIIIFVVVFAIFFKLGNSVGKKFRAKINQGKFK